jgi:hypothetical protein
MTLVEIEMFFINTGIRSTSNRGKVLKWPFEHQPYNTYYWINNITRDLDLSEEQILAPLKLMATNGENNVGTWNNVKERIILLGTQQVKLRTFS